MTYLSTQAAVPHCEWSRHGASGTHVISLSQKLSKVDYGKVAGHLFMERLIARFNLKNQAELGRICGIPPAVLSKMRHNTLQVQDWMLIAMHESFEVPIAELKDMLRACTVGENERSPDFVRQWRTGS